MRTLHHWVLDPFSRQVRIAFAEKGLRVRLKEERVWDGRQDFLALNPAGETPVLVESGAPRVVIVGARAILEYLEETKPEPPLLPTGPVERAEARRLADWFDRKFDAEVNAKLMVEKVDKKLTGQGAPNARAIRAGHEAMKLHLHYVAQLAEARGYLAGDRFTIADVAGAAHLSCIDYLGEADWDAFPMAKAWWRKVRARASYKALCEDRVQGLPPSKSYTQQAA
ncbi:MAG: glutathione S-transferase family protein [Maricaulaceae bacterium]|jgi:glutathione S-transferase